MVGGWRIPRLWEGCTVAVLASGPSMSQAVADALRGIPCIVVNSTFRLAPWADMLYAADSMWWHETPQALQFSGLKVSVEPVRGVLQIRNAGREGYSDDADCVHTFGNSGAQAIQIAAKAGASRILLIGFDMKGGHWHPDHVAPLRQTHSDTYGRWIEIMGGLASALGARGVEVLNCTPNSALKCWPIVELEDALARGVPAQ